MFLLGDSHTRSYVLSKHMNCVFIGSGKENNLSSLASILIYVLKLFIIKLYFKNIKSHSIGLVLGESDLRIAYYGDYHPNNQVRSDFQQKQHIDRVTRNFKRLILLLRFIGYEISFIIGSGTPNNELAKLSSELNFKFKVIAESFNIHFFDPQKVFNEHSFKEKFIGMSVFNSSELDSIHFSPYISKEFDRFAKKKIINISEKMETIRIKNRLIDIDYSDKFSCFRCKFSPFLNITIKIILHLEDLIRRNHSR